MMTRMNRNTRRRIVTHAIAVVAGLLLVGPGQRLLFSSADDDALGSAAAPSGSGEDAARAGGKAGGDAAGRGRAAVLRKAWQELAKRPLDRQSRLRAQTLLLNEWAKLDVDGAVEAYLGECWDSRVGDGDRGRDMLAEAFRAAFKEHPLEGWAALGRNKMGRELLGGAWIGTVLQEDPALVASLVGKMPPNLQRLAVANALYMGLKPDATEAFYEKLRTSGTPEQVEGWMQQLYQMAPLTGEGAAQAGAAELSAAWTALPAGGERTMKMAGWASTLKGADAAALAVEWDKVPAEDRGQAARMLLSQADSDSPALLNIYDLAVKAGEWQALANGAQEKLRGFDTDRQALAEWALKLPPRDELRGLFNLAISEKLLNDPAAGRAWLESLPPGDWRRERGFNEMMLGNLWVKGNKDAAQQAIDSITDPRARQQAIKDRYDWQLITGQEKMIRGE